MKIDEGVILLFQKALMNVVSQTFDLRGSGGSTEQMTKVPCVPHYCCTGFPWLGTSGIVSNIFNGVNAAFPSCCVTDKQTDKPTKKCHEFECVSSQDWSIIHN